MTNLRYNSFRASVFILVVTGSFSCGPRVDRSSMISTGQHGVSCTLESHEISARDIRVRLTFVNSTERAIGVYRWNLPVSNGLEADLFDIQHDGMAVAYRGMMVKRKVTPEDVIRIDPFTNASVIVSLADAYDVEGAGAYAISYHSFNPYGAGELQECRSNILAVRK